MHVLFAPRFCSCLAPQSRASTQSGAAAKPICLDDSAPVCAIPQFSLKPLLACSEQWSKLDKQKLRRERAGRLLGCVSYMTRAAGSNPVRKRALGACRRDTCFPSFRHRATRTGDGHDRVRLVEQILRARRGSLALRNEDDVNNDDKDP
ncbi:hypothetical protein SVAN01_07567 [Stagonosporopsis vannaccii]|nr:hypothetical protein SVAN01_07567 [Stagonosporopsis vannaccii]